VHHKHLIMTANVDPYMHKFIEGRNAFTVLLPSGVLAKGGSVKIKIGKHGLSWRY